MYPPRHRSLPEKTLRGLSFLSLAVSVATPLIAPSAMPFWTMFLSSLAAVAIGLACYLGSRLIEAEERASRLLTASQNAREAAPLG